MFRNRNLLVSSSFLLLVCCFGFSSCHTIDLYEKVEAIPSHQWRSSFKPQFHFAIKDTVSPYQVYLILRHNNNYKYNNIWVNLYAKGPVDSLQKFSLELPLASKDGWLGMGMDDIFEHRIAFTLDPEKFKFSRSGDYTFTLEQIMRDDPLPDVMNVGIRLEKKAQ